MGEQVFKPGMSWSQVAKVASDLFTHRDGEWCGFATGVARSAGG